MTVFWFKFRRGHTPGFGDSASPHGNSTMVPKFDISAYQSLLNAPAPKVAPKAKASSASSASVGAGSGLFYGRTNQTIFVFNLVMVSTLRLRGEVVKLTYSFTSQPCPSKDTASPLHPLHRCFSAVSWQAPPMRSQAKALQRRLTKNPRDPPNARDKVRGKQKRIKMIKVIKMRKTPRS